MEVGYRLSRHGLRLLFCEAALGYHHHVYTIDQAVRRYYDRGVNWGEFRRLVPEPQYLVYTHLLERDTWREYVAVLRGPNDLVGKDRYLAWHLLREAVRSIAMNRLTVTVVWRPLLALAERSGVAEALVNSKVYAAYLFYHFTRGVRDGKRQFGH